MKRVLKELMDDLKDSVSASARREQAALKAQDEAIKDIEKRIRDSRRTLRFKTDEPELKLSSNARVAIILQVETQELIRQVEAQLAALDSANRADQRKINALNKDREVLEERLAQIDSVLTAIGGRLTAEEAQRLILKKLYDLIHQELNRYLSAAKRGLLQALENLWDKYAVSAEELEQERAQTLKTLDWFLRGLGYLG